MNERKVDQVMGTVDDLLTNLSAVKGTGYAKMIAAVVSFSSACRMTGFPKSLITQLLEGIEESPRERLSFTEMSSDVITIIKILDSQFKGSDDEPT